ncbi:hypothetical protein ACET3Z_027463 [Daucus carota]
MPGDGCSPAYMPWYLEVTRRYMVNPTFWPRMDAFQGTQGATQSLEEQLLEVDPAIDPAAPGLNRAQSLLQGLIARVRGHRGPPTRRARDAGGPSGAGEWPRWTERATRVDTAGDDYVGGEGGFAVNLEDDEDTTAVGGHTPVSPPLQELYQFLDRDAYRPDMSFLAD